MADPTQPTIDDWRSLAEKELRGRPLDELTWNTPEGIAVKPLYTATDLEGMEHGGGLPGFAPFMRGPRATMYAGRPWTVRQYADFSTAEESNASYRRNLAAGQQGVSRGCRSPLIWPPIAATTRTTNWWSVTWARPGWRSTPSRI
ncbi:MAG: methylmalonyl-CoA mutase family protein [Candidatus Sedimenticola endophacoides]